MIETLTIVRRDENLMPWVDELESFKTNRSIAFKPGLNILFGANGSGKSTVVQLLATALAAAQGGVSTVTSSWLHDVCGFRGRELKLPCELVHDGQPLMFFDARAKEGLIGGSFDDDFFNLGIANTMARGSTGQLGLRRLDRLLQVLIEKSPAPAPAQAEPERKPVRRSTGKSLKDLERKGGSRALVPEGFPGEIVWKVARNAGGASRAYDERLVLVEELLRAKCPVGPKTLIFDEPESGFSLPWQAGIWSNVFSKVDPEKFQVIVATHSPFALNIPGANYIEMTPGYIGQCEAATLSCLTRLLHKESAK